MCPLQPSTIRTWKGLEHSDLLKSTCTIFLLAALEHTPRLTHTHTHTHVTKESSYYNYTILAVYICVPGRAEQSWRARIGSCNQLLCIPVHMPIMQACKQHPLKKTTVLLQSLNQLKIAIFMHEVKFCTSYETMITSLSHWTDSPHLQYYNSYQVPRKQTWLMLIVPLGLAWLGRIRPVWGELATDEIASKPDGQRCCPNIHPPLDS